MINEPRGAVFYMMNIRNVGIIAHVDHGKTTLVDALLRQSKTKLNKEDSEHDLIMDSNDLERERGITIFSKNASVNWNGTKINIIDTPGHADFGGEVERVLTMADGCLLLIDAKEGPMPQTRFVLKKALEKKLKIIVVVNKIDKPDARINHVLDKTLDLFLELGADDETADFPVIYASAKEGKAGLEPDLSIMTDISPVFDAIFKYVPASSGDPTKPLQLLVTTLSRDDYKGRIAIGRIYNGSAKQNQEVVQITRSSEMRKFRLTSLMTFEGLGRVDASEVLAGDIVAVSGIPDISIGETIADINDPVALPLLAIEEPTVKMTFSVNDSPLAGQEGEFKTSRQIRERLMKELETDMALRVEDTADGKWMVSGRGELHLAILIERMRREGYEFQVSRPQVILKEVNGKKLSPFERVFLEAPQDYSGIIMQKMGARKAKLEDMTTDDKGIVYFEFIIPTSALFGYRSEFITDTRGLGIINTNFDRFDIDAGDPIKREHGSLVASEAGQSNLYGLTNIQERGTLFIGPGVLVYKGQVVGENARSEDLHVNVTRAKQLSNMRSKGEGGMEHFNVPRVMDLEDSLEFVNDDELVEVTPKNVRIRKKILDEVIARRMKSQGLL
jgi:GTP-binding protein